MALRGGAHVVVATPGRLLDLLTTARCACPIWSCWCSTRPTACSTSALPTRSAACWPGCRRGAGAAVLGHDARRGGLLAGRVLHDPLRLDAPAAVSTPAPDIVQRSIEVDAAKRTRCCAS